VIRIDTPLLVIGRGPAALVVAKVAAGAGLPCLLAGHEVVGGDEPVALAADAIATLERHGLIDVLRPYLVGLDPPTVVPRDFEEVVKHHCVADLNVVVYDEVTVIEREHVDAGIRGVLTDGTSRWELLADQYVDADLLPTDLSAAIVAGALSALDAVAAQPLVPVVRSSPAVGEPAP
jgi:hypothetical protein